jgi:hypothetical protein
MKKIKKTIGTAQANRRRRAVLRNGQRSRLSVKRRERAAVPRRDILE